MTTSFTDPTQGEDARKQRMEELLWIIGGCEVAIINNDRSGDAYVKSYSDMFRKMQKQYLKKLERVANGLPEEDTRQ